MSNTKAERSPPPPSFLTKFDIANGRCEQSLDKIYFFRHFFLNIETKVYFMLKIIKTRIEFEN
jgi:hypothetical protein